MIWQENTEIFLSFKSWKTTNCALYLIFVIGFDLYKYFVVLPPHWHELWKQEKCSSF